MHPILAGQIKAARAILDWSQEDLALAARLSVATIRNIEQGNFPRHTTISQVRHSLEHAGIEFLDYEGVRRRIEDVQVLQGAYASDQFFDDIVRASDQAGIIILCKSERLLISALGLDRDNGKFKTFERMQNSKCLLSEIYTSTLELPFFELRIIPIFHAGPACYFVYGDRFVVAVADDENHFRFVLFKSTKLAHDYRSDFAQLWSQAVPFTKTT